MPFGINNKRAIFVFILGLGMVLFFGVEIHDCYCFVGTASWYGKRFGGRKTASGEIFDPEKLTAAHRRLPIGTKVKVTNLKNNRQIIVEINDRGPYIPGRIIDLSRKAARDLDMLKDGLSRVHLEIMQPD